MFFFYSAHPTNDVFFFLFWQMATSDDDDDDDFFNRKNYQNWNTPLAFPNPPPPKALAQMKVGHLTGAEQELSRAARTCQGPQAPSKDRGTAPQSLT